MATAWIYRLHLIIPKNYKNPANGQWHGVDSDTGGDKTFGSILLSASGNEPETHYAASTLADQALLDRFESKRVTMEGGGLQWWRVDSATNVLQATNVAASQASIGQAFTFFDAIGALGLQRIDTGGMG